VEPYKSFRFNKTLVVLKLSKSVRIHIIFFILSLSSLILLCNSSRLSCLSLAFQFFFVA